MDDRPSMVEHQIGDATIGWRWVFVPGLPLLVCRFECMNQFSDTFEPGSAVIDAFGEQ